MAPNSARPTQASTSTSRTAQLTGHLTSPKKTNNIKTRPTLPIEYPVSKIQIDATHSIDHVRELKVAVIGAGLAGINAGILLPAKVPGIKLTIYEKNSEVSGTWLENIYPGVRCDIPAHVYQSTFSPNTQWSEIFAKGAEIRDYWQSRAKKHDIYKYIKLRHRVEEAEWDTVLSTWHVKVHDLVDDIRTTEQFDFVITAIGRFNAWKLPNYPGLEDYKGFLRHTSNWDPSFDPTDKRIAVIGNGASGIQIVPNLQRISKHVTHFVRNPTWIATSWAGDERTFEPQPYSRELKESFEKPETYLAFRKDLEGRYWRGFRAMLRGSDENARIRDSFVAVMKKRVAKQPELLEGLIPDFSPHCRRLTPGPGYLESLSEDNTELVKTPIKRFTPTGIETINGTSYVFDAIFCATGANTDLVPPFPIKAHGVDLNKAWKPGGKWGFPYTYMGVATPGFPNVFFLAGPHATGPSGTVPHAVETALTYFAKVLRKASSQGIKSLSPSKEAANDFVDYCDAFFPETVLTDNCSSWNNGGLPSQRIHGLWPGSAAHITIVRREPRWEDWEYDRENKINRFSYFGNGYTQAEIDEDADLTSYLTAPEGGADLKGLHELWWDLPGAKKSTWYRSTLFNITILGLCNFSAPGIWGAMNSLGAGGAQSPRLVNAGNALTFCLMVVSCYFSSVLVRYIGIKGALIFGTIGYAPYAAALYTNNRFGTEWFIYLGSSLCGISAGVFWMAEAAIAIAYPEPWNKGKALGYWLTYRLGGQILGGAINLGLNAARDQACSVTYTVYLVFIALQCVGPIVAWFLNSPDKVERKDGKKVQLSILTNPWFEIRETTRLLFTRCFLLILLWIGQVVFAEAVYFTYLALWFSVRARALGSFLSGIVAVICGNLLGAYIDRSSIPLRVRARSTFWLLVVLQGAFWLWATVLVTEFRVSQPTYDWTSPGFGRAFAVFVFLTVTFQLNYLFLYFIIGNLATNEPEIIRFAGLLRGTESAWQAISYGITSVTIFAEVGAVYWNFALWAVAIVPAWLVIKEFGDTRQMIFEQTHAESITSPIKVEKGGNLQPA